MSISSYHIGAHPELYELSRNNAFEFIVNPDLQGKILFPDAQKDNLQDNDYLKSVQETIAISVMEASVPHFKLDTVEIKRGNSRVTYAGTPSFTDGSIKLHDYVGARTKDILMGWHALAYDINTDVVNLAGEYKYDCYLIEYTPDFSKEVRKWILKGCWISEISEDPFTQDNHEDREITVTLVYDRAIPVIQREI